MGSPPFPYLSIDLDQATMIIIAAAKQTRFFYDIANYVGFWGDFAIALALIGFTILVFGVLFQQLGMKEVSCWLILFLLMMILPTFWTKTGSKGDPLFFHEMLPNTIDWANSPYALVPGGPPIPGGRTPLNEMEDAGIERNASIKIWTPQIVAIDVLNRLRAQLAVTFERDRNDPLSGEIAAIQMLRRSQVLDYRPHFDMAMFLTLCGNKVPRIRESELWLNEAEMRSADAQLLQDLRSATFSVADLIRSQQLFWDEWDRLSEAADTANCGESPPESGEEARACAQIRTMGLPPLGELKRSASRGRTGRGRTTRGTSAEIFLNNTTNPHHSVLFDGGSSWDRFRNTEQVSASRIDFNRFVASIGTHDAENAAALRATPVNLLMARVDDNGTVNPDGTALFGRPKYTNCLEVHQRVIESFDVSRRAYLDDAQKLEELLNRYAPNPTGRTAQDIPSHIRAYMAYQALEQQLEQCSGRQAAACRNRIIRNRADLERLMLSSAMTNAQPDVDAIVARAMTTEGSFGSPIRDLASRFGSSFAPVAVFFKGLFGGFEAGTYAAIMPMLISYFLALTIICTPLIMLVGLALPSHAFGTLVAPIIVVVYLKFVEASFVLVKGVFGLLLALSNKYSGIMPSQMSSFHDIVLGMAYTAVFLISLVILFGLKDPGRLIQQVAGKADGMAKISSAEAMAMAATPIAVAKTVGAFLIPGGAGLKALGAMSGAVENLKPGGTGEGYLGALSNTVKEGKAEALGRSLKRQDMAQEVAYLSQEAPEDKDMRARARAFRRVDDEAKDRAKGAGIAGLWTAERSFKEQNGNVTVDRKLDPPQVVVAEAISKASPEDKEISYRITQELIQRQALKITRDDAGLARIEINERALSTLPANMHKALAQIKASAGLVERTTKDGRKFTSIDE